MEGFIILMNCFDNLIGIHRNCDETTPSSGLWIQDLEGINLSVANAAIDNETISGIKLIEEKITFAQNAIAATLRNQLANKVRIQSILQNDTVGYYRDNLRVVSAEAGKLKGIRVKVQKYPYLEFFLSRIFLKLKDAVTTNVYVYDLLSNTLLDTIPVTTSARVATAVTVNKAYQTNRQRLHLFICFDSSVSDTYETNLLSSDCASCYGHEYSNKYISFYGGLIGSGEDKIDSNVRSNSGTNGISLEYTLNCSVEPFICNMGNQLAWPLLHKVGAELMKELLASRRLNSVVVIDKEKNVMLRDKFEAEYMASMSAILDNMKLPNDVCFKCNQPVRKAVAIP
jgi:hypothetical protein